MPRDMWKREANRCRYGQSRPRHKDWGTKKLRKEYKQTHPKNIKQRPSKKVRRMMNSPGYWKKKEQYMKDVEKFLEG